MSKEVMKLALEALEKAESRDGYFTYITEIEVLREALAAPVQEPVAWVDALFDAIKHGDAEHQNWLQEKLKSWVIVNPPAQPAPVQEPVYHLRQFGDVTKEQLDRYIATGDINPQPAPVQPVAWRWVNPKGWLTYGEAPHDTFKSTPLYTTPPSQPAPAPGYCKHCKQYTIEEPLTAAQPAVPDALTSADIQEHIEYVAGWNDCRQAMMEMMK